MRKIVLIVHNVRSTYNVGSLLRTAEGIGVEKVYLCGYTPYPAITDDSRLPHVARRVDSQISKTALGAEKTVPWNKVGDIEECLESLKVEKYLVAALEQTDKSTKLNEYRAPAKIALVVGNEIDGLENRLLDRIDVHLEIPMLGSKESFNVSVAAAMALYRIRYG